MNSRTLLRTGIVGPVVAAVCCATPVLAILLGVVGLSAWTGWLDVILIPALVVFMAMTVYAWKRSRASGACCAGPDRSGADGRGGAT